MKKYELQGCGTVMSLDLTKHEDFGHIVVELTGDEIKRITDITKNMELNEKVKLIFS